RVVRAGVTRVTGTRIARVVRAGVTRVTGTRIARITRAGVAGLLTRDRAGSRELDNRRFVRAVVHRPRAIVVHVHDEAVDPELVSGNIRVPRDPILDVDEDIAANGQRPRRAGRIVGRHQTQAGCSVQSVLGLHGVHALPSPRI